VNIEKVVEGTGNSKNTDQRHEHGEHRKKKIYFMMLLWTECVGVYY
jgi:hypothetical protein